MSEKTLIAWTDHTFNIAWGCVKISPGCKNCYADNLSRRYGQHVWGKNAPRRTFGEKHWDEPIKWVRDWARGEWGCLGRNQPHLVFCSSMCDVFEDHPTIDSERDKLWPLIRATSPALHWQLLTKRPERIADNLPIDWGDGYPNVWLGTSIENNDYVGRADHLRGIPAAVRFISYEPALSALPGLNLEGLDWIIYGGESGPGFRPHNLDWPREMERRCADARVAFFFKQSSAIRTEMGIMLDGRLVRNFPVPRTVTSDKFALVA